MIRSFILHIDADNRADDIGDIMRLSNMHICPESIENPNKENQKPQKAWYEGIVHRPVAFRAARRMTSD